MSSGIHFINELTRIVSGALRLDVDKVRNYTAFLADKIEAEGDKPSADRLRKLLAESDTQLRPTELRSTRVLPVDSESRFPLIEHIKIKTLNESPVHLTPPQWEVVNEFVSVAKTYTVGESHDIGGALSMLMYGPPGTGKSRLARYIARELGLDLYVARLDGLISSYLGSTSKNIRALFDFAARTPCVLFLDEFDAIAKVRGDQQELGELKRVVNSFLQNLDTLGRQSIIVAATNHEQLLDAAVWRRFSYRIALDVPSAPVRREMWSDFLEPIPFQARDLDALADLSDGFSGSDIRETAIRFKRRQLTSAKPLELKDAFSVLLNLAVSGEEGERFAAKLVNKNPEAMVHLLRERDPKLYSLAVIADLLGVSKATAQRLSKRDGEEHG